MKIERAIEILDPDHREHYESIEPVNEACRMGATALHRRIPATPHPEDSPNILACPICGSGEYLHNEDGTQNSFCGQCGQAIDWAVDGNTLDKTPRPVLKYPGSKWKTADWIISLMPPHKSYLEPFFGSGAVYFKKPPSRIETINDMDGEIVNLFRCIIWNFMDESGLHDCDSYDIACCIEKDYPRAARTIAQIYRDHIQPVVKKLAKGEQL